MNTMDYEACYAALELRFGAGLKEVNECWRRLSKKHHPDRHARNPKAHQIALEKQKQLNNARDILKKWFEMNPHVTPPRTTSHTQSQTQNKTGGSQCSSSGNAGKAQSNKSSQAKQGNQSKQHHSQTNNHQWHYNHAKSSASEGQSAQAASPTGWFTASSFKFTPLQEFIHKVETDSADEPTALALILGFAALFGPLFVISGVLGALFPELPGHYPDWLAMTMLLCSGWCSCYILRWFFAEAELIKLQKKELYFRSHRTLGDTVDLAKGIIGKHTVANGTWKFLASGAAHEATLHFEEEVFPDVKRKRCLKIRFEARPATASVMFAIQVKATSPVNSFSCKHIAAKVVAELKKELHHIAA